jgi:hypothetical protein
MIKAAPELKYFQVVLKIVRITFPLVHNTISSRIEGKGVIQVLISDLMGKNDLEQLYSFFIQRLILQAGSIVKLVP